jgi:hypothetical protein
MRYTEFKLTEAKEEKLKHGSTKGHMGEYLIGSAVVAKFVKGAEDITVDDVKAVMNQTSATDNLSNTFNGAEGDEIEFVNIIKNKKNIADAKDVEALADVMLGEIQGAVKFANSDIYAKRWAKIFAENGKPDKLLVKAAGEEDQKGAKADIWLYYVRPDNPEPRKIKGWSLKTGSNLIGQGSPRTFANMEVFFKELGINLKPIEGYDEAPQEHISSVYQQVASSLNSMTAGDDDAKEATLVKNLANFMDHHIALKDPRVYIVNLGKGDYSAQTVSKMIKNLPSVDLESTLKKGGRPAVLVHAKGNPKNLLFMVRYTYTAPRWSNSQNRQEPERHRMFVETGPLFKTLATISVKDVDNE